MKYNAVELQSLITNTKLTGFDRI